MLVLELEALFFREHFHTAILTHCLDVLELLDRFLDRLIVGQKAAEPSVIDVILPATLCLFLDRLLSLSFRSDKQDLLIRPLGKRFGDVIERVAEEFLSLLQVNNINAV